MEVNKLTYNIYKFLRKKKWSYNGESDEKFIYLVPSNEIGLPDNFKLKLPIQNRSSDFHSYIKKILNLVSELYSKDTKEILQIHDLNEKLKNRYKKQWIIPEDRSRIDKLSKHDIYIPHSTL